MCPIGFVDTPARFPKLTFNWIWRFFLVTDSVKKLQVVEFQALNICLQIQTFKRIQLNWQFAKRSQNLTFKVNFHTNLSNFFWLNTLTLEAWLFFDNFNFQILIFFKFMPNFLINDFPWVYAFYDLGSLLHHISVIKKCFGLD